MARPKKYPCIFLDQGEFSGYWYVNLFINKKVVMCPKEATQTEEQATKIANEIAKTLNIKIVDKYPD